jgi:hypothetical protein
VWGASPWVPYLVPAPLPAVRSGGCWLLIASSGRGRERPWGALAPAANSLPLLWHVQVSLVLLTEPCQTSLGSAPCTLPTPGACSSQGQVHGNLDAPVHLKFLFVPRQVIWQRSRSSSREVPSAAETHDTGAPVPSSFFFLILP